MCGIVGFHTTRKVDLLRDVARMRDTLVHRGPDAAGAFVVPENGLALGHRRLAILDLTDAGTQPMCVANKKLSITFNGEIYNFEILREELLDHGYRFETSTDTEVLLRAYQHWGADVLDQLDGMFAFAIYDRLRQELFCARDRSGEKPFYYFLSKQTFAFASECKALFALSESPRQIDYKSLRQYLAFGYCPNDRTMVDGIKKLQPGHKLTYSLRGRHLKISQYWTPATSLLTPLNDVHQCADYLHELLEKSIRKQLVADVPVGILLSGGIDSSIIAAIASTLTPSPLKTFTAIFPGAGVYNEAKYAKEVAKHVGSVHEELVVEQQPVDILSKLAVQFDEPIADSSMIPAFLLCSLIREHATVALGGDGADELFGGYPHHRWFSQLAAFRQWMPKQLQLPLHKLAARCIPVGTRGRNFLLGLLSPKEKALDQFNVYFSEAATKQILSDSSLQAMNHLDLDFEIHRLSTQLTEDIGSDNIPLIDFLSYLPNDILAKVDRASMLTSLEVRSPWLDKQIIEYAYEKIPIRLKYSPKKLKCIPKALAARLLPDSLDLNRKQGFSIPLHKWFSGEWGGFFNEVLMESDSNLFKRDGLAELMRNPGNAGRNVQRLFALTMLELWRREYGICT